LTEESQDGRVKPVRASVDRIAEDASGTKLAVLVFDDQQQLILPLEQLPVETKSGSVLTLVFALDQCETGKRVKEIAELQNELFG
jgi:hypothetical protein